MSRVLVRMLLLVVVPAIAVVALLQWYARNERYVTTDNAYIKADIISISPSIDGRVVAISVVDDQHVRADDVLFRLDDRPYRIAVASARARLESVRNEIDSLRAEYAQSEVEITNAGERVKFLKRKLSRQNELRKQGLGTAARVDELEYEVIEAQQRVRSATQRSRQTLAELGGDRSLPAEQHPGFLTALAAHEEARLFLDYTVVRAPTAGTVSRMKLQPGEWVEAGKPVFGLVDTHDLWVEANLKETQLTHVRVGQAVNFGIDAYPGVEWQGRVASISSATGSEFLLLPAQNATGNWVKVVQRVPVRIELVPAQDAPPMRAGMTVDVSIDTERQRPMWAMVREAVAAIGDR